MQRKLMIENWDKMEVDCVALHYRMMGSSIHYVLEQAAKDRLGVQTEIRLNLPPACFGIEIRGRADWLDYTESTLGDIKTCSTYTDGREIKEEWIQQLNIYRYILRRVFDYTADNLRVFPYFKDWSLSQTTNSNYPKSPYGCIEIPVWEWKQTHDFIEKRVAENLQENIRFCTDEERWKIPPRYAVMRKGYKKALAATMVVDGNRTDILSREAAQSIINQKGLHSDKDVYIEERKGECRRCENYCDMRDVCKITNADKWKEDLK